MALTKGATALATNVTTTSTTSAVDVSDAYAPGITWSIVQVGTATTAARFTVEVSVDGGTTYRGVQSVAAGLAAGTYSDSIALDPFVTHVRLAFTQQSGGTSSTLNAQVGEVTGL